MATSFYSEEELKNLGLKSYGKNVLLSRNAMLYGIGNISIGDNSRIDDFCILSGNIDIGHNVHIASGVYLFAGNSGIEIKDYVGISSRSVVYAESDDYSGTALTNPTIPAEYKNVTGEKVVFHKHSLIGTGCTVLPGVVIGEGVSVGSMSLINKSLDEWKMYFGIPCKYYKDRKKDLLELENRYINS